jgi:hypothetical protein
MASVAAAPSAREGGEARREGSEARAGESGEARREGSEARRVARERGAEPQAQAQAQARRMRGVE